jgi:hypothetical protein
MAEANDQGVKKESTVEVSSPGISIELPAAQYVAPRFDFFFYFSFFPMVFGGFFLGKGSSVVI